jgi:hypothetical protein
MMRPRPQDEPPIEVGRRPNWTRFLIFAGLAAVVILLCWLFPRALGFVEIAGREARYLWWLILMVVLGVWLIWGYRRSTK